MRSRLTLALSLMAAGAIIVLGMAVYALIKREMIHQLDHALEDKLRFFSAFCRQKDGMIGFSMSKTYFERIRDTSDPEFFQYRFQNGKNIRRSASLRGGDLPVIGLGEGRLEFTNVSLIGGHQGRCGGISFYPETANESEVPKLINVVVAHDGDRIWDALEHVKSRIITVGGFALFVLGLITWWIIRAGMYPLRSLTRQIESMPVGESGDRFLLSQPTAEIQPVVERLNQMMQRVEDAIHSERQFTANAAHELRNPIAGISAQLEVALLDEGLSEDTRESVQMALDVGTSLQRTVENLLQLARLESESEVIEEEPVDVSRLLRRAWKTVFEAAEAKQLELTWEVDEELEPFMTSHELLHVAVTNLFGNAVEYTDKGKQVKVVAISGKDTLEIQVFNTVRDVSEDDVRRMFDRFWRSSGQNQTDSQGHSGIGLSLCRRIAKALGGAISAELVSADMLKISLLVSKKV
jgi:signal transduction histidine kinase